MDFLSEISSKVKQTAESILDRKFSTGMTPVVCFSDETCVYESDTSPTGLASCDKDMVCKTIKTCPENEVFIEPKNACVKIGSECEVPINHRLVKYTELGSCELAPECEQYWRWNEDSQRCDWNRKGEICDSIPSQTGPVDRLRISRLDADGICKQQKECTSGVFSETMGQCVIPGLICDSINEDKRVRKFDFTGKCSVTDECIENWTFADGSCAWTDRGRICKPTQTDTELDFVDDKRAFEYDANGACLSTTRCLDSWVFDGTRCIHPNAGKQNSVRNGRIFEFDETGNVVAKSCLEGWSLVGNHCTFDKIGQTCSIQEGQIFQFGALGECNPTDKCENLSHIIRDGKCVPKPQGCPDGFSVQGNECYRSFGTGGEGSTSISFHVLPSEEFRVRYDFKKEPRYKDGDYSLSSNFGFSGGANDIVDSHSISSGYLRGHSHCVVNIKQNDGAGTIHVWIKR
jgi:hypothetical protein